MKKANVTAAASGRAAPPAGWTLCVRTPVGGDVYLEEIPGKEKESLVDVMKHERTGTIRNGGRSITDHRFLPSGSQRLRWLPNGGVSAATFTPARRSSGGIK